MAKVMDADKAVKGNLACNMGRIPVRPGLVLSKESSSSQSIQNSPTKIRLPASPQPSNWSTACTVLS